MNAKAARSGATHSHFREPERSADSGSVSTARDLSIIARAAYANPTIRSIVCLPQLAFRYANGRTRELENTNKVLKRLPYCNGMKTGYTEAAGHCLIASGIPGRDVIVVVLGDSKSGVWRMLPRLLSWGLRRCRSRALGARHERSLSEQLQALRAHSLHRKLREIGTAQGPEVADRRSSARQLFLERLSRAGGDPIAAPGGDAIDRGVRRRSGSVAFDQWNAVTPHRARCRPWPAGSGRQPRLFQQRICRGGRHFARAGIQRGCRHPR